jgi:hypothetical protein
VISEDPAIRSLYSIFDEAVDSGLTRDEVADVLDHLALHHRDEQPVLDQIKQALDERLEARTLRPAP